ncbi:RNF213 [Mytilus edulis]|uniref:RNF213 n=1 Tax=Mytilus edulis TaxID=6550 RepID=A0A8S3RSA6_MYTED|nr:RNF213 [Mytilus edulis]
MVFISWRHVLHFTTDICKCIVRSAEKLSASVFFRTTSISAMIGDKTIPSVKSNLVKALVNASQEFACRSVQSCRSLQEASIVVSATCESFKEVNSAEELAQRVAGMIRWEDSNHLMILFHQNVQTVSALYRNKLKIPPAIRTLFESQMKKILMTLKINLSENYRKSYRCSLVISNLNFRIRARRKRTSSQDWFIACILPEALIDFVWDYGSLDEKDEKLYISKMVGNVFIDFFESNLYETILTELLAMSQSLVRVMEATDSCVSLRDVDRCKKLVVWLLKFLRMKNTKTEYNYGIEMKAIVLALAVSYHSRFADVETRTSYRENVSMIVSKHNRPITADKVLEIIRDEEDEILNRMDLPNGIAKNRALQENVFVVLVCILNKIPIFLVGKPGCSKSLSIQLIRSNLRGRDSKDELFQNMPQLFCVSFQGSESSTSDGIIKVFEKAENYQKLNDKDVISVVILDEIGLAEVSRFNPLKVLHGLLEPGSRQTPNVAVVGISNWALDAAK